MKRVGVGYRVLALEVGVWLGEGVVKGEMLPPQLLCRLQASFPLTILGLSLSREGQQAFHP